MRVVNYIHVKSSNPLRFSFDARRGEERRGGRGGGGRRGNEENNIADGGGNYGRDIIIRGQRGRSMGVWE